MPTALKTTALEFDGACLRILDQRQLPGREEWVAVRDAAHMVELIQGLAVRGAPLIGVAGALALASCARARGLDRALIAQDAAALREARPTAVNLAAMIDRMLAENPGLTPDGLAASARAIAEEDIRLCEAIAEHGAALIADGDGVMTICNTGALATAGCGTALGVIARAHALGRRIHVYACETRPLLQGARLTAWELARLGIPHTLICDGAAAAVMASGRVQKVFVGADRIARNGDSANKIGTYALAVAAAHHRIPCYVVAPSTTVDRGCPDGLAIPIEERGAEEVRGARGSFGAVRWAPERVPTANPAFDVTPRCLLAGIVLESGLMPAEAAVAQRGSSPSANAHTRDSAAALLATIPRAREILGGEPGAWTCREFGDGNLNLLFRVDGSRGSLILKQAVPYLRCVGEAWPLAVERVRFESEAMRVFGALAPAHVPEHIHFDQASNSLAMEFLAGHVVLRKALMRGERYPLLAGHLGEYLALTLVGTSQAALSSARKRALTGAFSANSALCAITEQLIFTDPYRLSAHNRWTAPDLDAEASRLRADSEAKIAIVELKRRFLDAGEALIHGDFHTGSVMVTPASTMVIDPEFAVAGPAGFDCGLMLANFLLAYVSQGGHEGYAGERDAHREWLLEVVEGFWSRFCERYHELMAAAEGGERVSPGLWGAQERRAAIARLAGEDLERIFTDTVGFAGAEMIRRILGLAHVEDLESIADRGARARCERAGLALARDLLVHRGHYQRMNEVASRARSARARLAVEVAGHGR